MNKTVSEQIADTLEEIEQNDTNYIARSELVMKAVWLATKIHYPAGFRFDPKEPEWPVAFIELPTGQVSWHMPQFPFAYDGHSTDDKYHRCRQYIAWMRPTEEAPQQP